MTILAGYVARMVGMKNSDKIWSGQPKGSNLWDTIAQMGK